MRPAKTLFALGIMLSLPCAGLADEEKNPDAAAAHVRHALMEVMGWNMTEVADMSTGKQAYDAARAATLGQRLEALGGMIGDAFARDTSGASAYTEALDAIWQQPEDFAAKTGDMVDAARAYTAATADSQPVARRAFVALGDTCKACHEDYKSD
jgi:cytochrome c556